MKQLKIKIPSKLKLKIIDTKTILTFSNSENSVNLKISDTLNISLTDNVLTITPKNNNNNNKYKQLLGLYKTLIHNCIKGLTQNFKIIMNLKGVGFKVGLIDKKLNFKLGFSHEILLEIPETIKVQIFKPTQIILLGHNLNEITQFAHNIKKLKKLDPYKGKGVFLSYDTPISLKEGKRNKR